VNEGGSELSRGSEIPHFTPHLTLPLGSYGVRRTIFVSVALLTDVGA